MKMSQAVLKGFIKAAQDNVEADVLQDDTFGEVKSYILDDAILSFRKGGEYASFMGLSFEALGQNFHVIPTGEILLEGEDEEDTMVVDDAPFMTLLEEFLTWRTRVMGEMKI